jgi:hypothetical protein
MTVREITPLFITSNLFMSRWPITARLLSGARSRCARKAGALAGLGFDGLTACGTTSAPQGVSEHDTDFVHALPDMLLVLVERLLATFLIVVRLDDLQVPPVGGSGPRPS